MEQGTQAVDDPQARYFRVPGGQALAEIIVVTILIIWYVVQQAYQGLKIQFLPGTVNAPQEAGTYLQQRA